MILRKKEDMNQIMHLQTDNEFQHNEIKKLNSKFNVQMFSARIRSGKAFAAKQKIRDFKKLLFKSKRIQKNSLSKRTDAKKTNSKNNR